LCSKDNFKIEPTNDYVFKRIFGSVGNEDITREEYLEYKQKYEQDIIKTKATKPMTFRDVLQDAYNNRTSSFTYQGKTFYLKVNKNDSEMIYICNETEILGEFCTDGDEFIIELNDKNKIFGYEPNKPLKMKYPREDNSLQI